MRRLFGGSSKSNKQQPAETTGAIVQSSNLSSNFADQGTGVGLTSSPERQAPHSPSGSSQHTTQVQTYASVNKKAQAKNRNVNVVEMLEFVKSLEVDPVKESEMLWIAEEAYQAQLPPGWEEHTDEHGRTYFHNMATGDSCWQHPMDGLFKQIIEYWRRVQSSGGFWEIEDELAQMEEQIRLDLQFWMELFDEHGEKFYYNKRTEESRFDDPRNGVYHDLYARIRMVAKMKERLPLLAQAPRPEDPTLAEEQLQRQLKDQEDAMMDAVVRIQSSARQLLAKRKVRCLREKNLVGRGYQPLKGRVELRLRKGERGKEVVLKTTQAHRQFKAAQKIQAHVRSHQTRQHLGPVVEHRAHLNKVARLIQTRARAFLKKKREEREALRRVEAAASLIASSLQIFTAREYVKNLIDGRKLFDRNVAAAIKIQTHMRRVLAQREAQRRREHRDDMAMKRIQSCFKVFLARSHAVRCQQEDEPFEMSLRFTEDPQLQGTIPVTWKLIMHPIDRRGHALEQSRYCRAYDERDMSKGLLNHQPHDLFSKLDPLTYAKRQASVKMQAIGRSFLARKRVQRRVAVMNQLTDEFNTNIFKLIDLRQKSAVRIQSRVRGIFARKQDHIGQRKEKWRQKIQPQVQKAQAYLRRFLSQQWLSHFVAEGTEEHAAIIIQANWRAWLARKQVARMSEIVLFPMTGWFSYTGMGLDAVRVDVQFVPNTNFDEFRHFCKYGSMDDLYDSLAIMEGEVNEAKQHCDKRSAARESREEKEARAKAEKQAKELEEKQKQSMPALSRTGSARSTRSKASEKSGTLRPGKLSRTQSKDGPEEVSQQDGPGDSKAPSAIGTARSGRLNQPGLSRLASNRSDRPTSPWLKTQGELLSGTWSPRRGHLISGDIPRDREEKQRDVPKELPDDGKQPLSPITAPLPVKRSASSSLSATQPNQLRGSSSRLLSPSSQSPPQVVDSPKMINVDEEGQVGRSTSGLGGTMGRVMETVGRPTGEVMNSEVEDKTKDQSALQVLQDAALEGGLASSSRSNVPLGAPRKHYAGAFVNGQFVKSHRKVEDLTEEEQAQVIKDLQDERRRKVEELIRRQKKHNAKRKKQQQLEAEKLGQVSPGQFFEDEGRRRKVRELKRWLKKKEAEEHAKLHPMDKAFKAASEDPQFEKLQQGKEELLHRRANIQATRLKAMDINMDPAKSQQSRVLHRHVHHHVHYHDGVSDDEVPGQMPMMQHSASEGAFRSYPRQSSGTNSQVPTASMPWRPLVHSASVGQNLPGRTMPGNTMQGNHDPYGMMRTVEAFRQPPPVAAWQHGGMDPQGAPMPSPPPPMSLATH